MGSVYVVSDTSESQPMTRIQCKNEATELQLLLENNLNLLPGDQINPDDPRKWLLIKREMPVPDPNTGSPRWSVDFFLVDQDAIPTFVECKRFADTRSRREIVGQVLEYAANGHHYWTTDIIRSYVEQSCKKRNVSLEEALEALSPESESNDEFFERVQQNLREGQVRLVFFLEDSPFELRSVVDFLNKQMERSEVLLVEARQYCADNLKIVVPTLFGYTEQARLIKKTVTIKSPFEKKKWDKASFFEDARSKLDDEGFRALEKLFNGCVSSGFEIAWGAGAKNGSFAVFDRQFCPRPLITVWSYGSLQINFGYINGTEAAEQGRDILKQKIKDLGIQIPDMKLPTFPITEWKSKTDEIVSFLVEMVRGYGE